MVSNPLSSQKFFKWMQCSFYSSDTDLLCFWPFSLPYVWMESAFFQGLQWRFELARDRIHMLFVIKSNKSFRSKNWTRDLHSSTVPAESQQKFVNKRLFSQYPSEVWCPLTPISVSESYSNRYTKLLWIAESAYYKIFYSCQFEEWYSESKLCRVW